MYGGLGTRLAVSVWWSGNETSSQRFTKILVVGDLGEIPVGNYVREKTSCETGFGN